MTWTFGNTKDRTPHAGDSLLMAARHVLDVEPSRIVRPQARDFSSTLRRPRRIGAIYPGGMHAHPILEVCIALHGEALLHVQDQAYLFVLPALGILLPGTLHAARAVMLSLIGELCRREALAGSHEDSSGRACRRHEHVLEQIKSLLDNRLAEDITVEHLANLTRMTPRYVNQIFRRWQGEPIHEYLVRRRMEMAMELCRQGDLLIKQISQRVGYHDPLYFSRAFRKYHGISPVQA